MVGMSGYAGDITATEAWELLDSTPDAVLVDVRTVGEWQQVGVPQAPGEHEPHFIEWVHAGGVPNEAFMDQLLAIGAEPGAPMVFLCRSGQRSIGAATAATAAGLGPAYNVIAGFEAPSGWVDTGLPWHRD